MKPTQTPQQERLNTITHALGIVFCLIAIPVLLFYVYRQGEANMLWAVSVFGFGMLMVYTSSTLYHAASKSNIKRILRIWDHISIFLLIAGSYTPLVVKYTQASTATTFLGIMWSIVVVGSVLKIFYTGQFKIIELLLYIGLGCMAVFIAEPLAKNIPLSVFWWVLGGGLCYLGGVTFYVWKKWYYHHAIWHCFVLAGTITHYIAIFKGTTA